MKFTMVISAIVTTGLLSFSAQAQQNTLRATDNKADSRLTLPPNLVVGAGFKNTNEPKPEPEPQLITFNNLSNLSEKTH